MNSALSEVIRSWPSDVPFCARTAASQCSSLVTNDQLFDLAIEECLDEIDRKRTIDISPFLHRFPEIADRLLPALNAIPQVTDHGWPRVGGTIDGHKIVQYLGISESSRVYLVDDEKAGGRATVLKVTATPTNESVYLARLNHPSLPTLYQGDKDAKYLLLQYVAGPNAMVFLSSHAATIADNSQGSGERRREYHNRAVLAMECMASAIDHIHARGVAHNDIKPSNIIIGESQTLLIDFDAAADIGIHGTRRPIGTIDYLSNESLEELSRNGQLVGQNCIQDDHFAFAVTCFEMLTGNLPWKRHRDEISHRVCKEIIEKRKRLSMSSVASTMMPQTLAQEFCRIFSSAIRPPSPTHLVKLIASHYGVAARHRYRIAIGASTTSALAFILLIVLYLPFEGQKRLQSSVEASPVVAARNPTSPSVQQLYRTPNPFIGGSDSYRFCQQISANDESKLSADDAAKFAYALSLIKPEHDRQVHLYEISIANGEANAAIWNNYGFSLACLRRPADARKAFQAAIQLDPNLPQPYFHLAQLDDVCPGKNGAAPVGVSAFAALSRIPNEPTVRSLAASALRTLGSKNDGQASQETAKRLLELLSETRDLPLSHSISACVNPFPVTHRGGPDFAYRSCDTADFERRTP